MENRMVRLLVRNAVRCIACGSILESKTRHNYVKCNCPNETECDGGLEYQRTLAVDLDKVEDLSVWKEIPKEEYQKLVDKRNEDMYVGILKYYSSLKIKD